MSVDLMTQARYKELCEEINLHNIAYYIEARPSISDAEFDRLYKELEAIEKEFPELVSPDSPTQKIGGSKRINRLPLGRSAIGGVIDVRVIVVPSPGPSLVSGINHLRPFRPFGMAIAK